MTKMNVKGISVSILKIEKEDYLSLTDMIKAKDGYFFIADWLRNRNTMEFLGIWEEIHNPDFNYGEFALIRNRAGLNNFRISVKEFVNRTNAIGLKAASGRYGGTYAHKDIAFEFGMWVSAEFKIYLIKEFQRLKEEEQKRLQLDWKLRRELVKINYNIHTQSIKENLIPPEVSEEEANNIYASEADVLNKALYGLTSKEWKEKDSSTKGNLRDYSNILQLVVLANLESFNSILIDEGLTQKERLMKLNQIAISQMKVLTDNRNVKKIENIK